MKPHTAINHIQEVFGNRDEVLYTCKTSLAASAFSPTHDALPVQAVHVVDDAPIIADSQCFDIEDGAGGCSCHPTEENAYTVLSVVNAKVHRRRLLYPTVAHGHFSKSMVSVLVHIAVFQHADVEEESSMQVQPFV